MGSIHPSVHPTTFPIQATSQEQREKRVEDNHRKRKSPYEFARNMSVTSVSVYSHCDGPFLGLLTFSWQKEELYFLVPN